MNTITLSQLCPKVFQEQSVLVSDIWRQDVCLEKGKTYLIEAASGTGKSSLLSYLCGYRNDYTGHLIFDQQDVSSFSLKEWGLLRTRHISYLIQDLRLFPELTAFENIEIKNRLTHHFSKEQIEERLSLLGIGDKRDIAAGKMSFGQQQRVALLRALAQPFDFLLIDEPISHLDETNALHMAELILAEAQKQQAAVIATSIGKHLNIHYDNIYHL